MASPEEAAADGFAIADTMYADGIEALEQNDFIEASDFLAQCLQFHAERSGDTSVDAALVGLKYAEALLGCARIKGSSILSGLGKVRIHSLVTNNALCPSQPVHVQYCVTRNV